MLRAVQAAARHAVPTALLLLCHTLLARADSATYLPLVTRQPGAVSACPVTSTNRYSAGLAYQFDLDDPVRPAGNHADKNLALRGFSPNTDPDLHRAEERRLFYVAMTRARDELILSHAASGREGGRALRPSPFLSEALGRDVDAVPEAAELAAPRQANQPRPDPAASSVITTDEPLDLSFSQIDDYLACPLKYRLRHQVRVPTPPHHALVFGNALHQAVALGNSRRLRGETVGPDALEAALETHWRNEGFLSQEHETRSQGLFRNL